ncbi:serine/threonine-protein kinase [Embleya sp. NPDC005575]|uniref:WD40 repeat domain-containing serine/threonine protein kinase n=1 Tax=Embleya sp. NPDC005575 TaxID=3156892 RepID=UPI0033BCE679
MVARVLAGRYELVRFVGRGGMGEVWEGRDRAIERRVAIKLLVHDVRDTSGAALFLREARVAGGLNHPGVVTVYDLGQDPGEGTLFLVMEFLTGRDLATVLSKDGPPPVVTAVDWAARAATALAAAHDAGVVHRDLKPANLMLTTAGDVKVLDFGIARYVESTHHSSKVMGTLAYMPPERFDEQPGDTRSDLYSLGCVLHELLTGNPPFDATGPVSMMNAHLRRAPRPPGAVRAGVPTGLDDLVLALLAKDPEHRPASALDVAKRLTRLTTHRAPAPDRSATSADGPSPQSATTRRNPGRLSDHTATTPADHNQGIRHHRGPTSTVPTVTSPRVAPGATEFVYELRRTLTKDTTVASVNAVAFSPDGRTFAAGDSQGDVQLWDPLTGERLHLLNGTKCVHALAFHPDGHTLAASDGDESVRLWDPHTGTPRGRLAGYTRTVNSLVFSPDGRILVIGTYGECRLWDTQTGKAMPDLSGPLGRTGLSAATGPTALSPNGQVLATRDANGSVCIWDLHTRKPRRRRLTGEDRDNLSLTRLAYSPDGRQLAAVWYPGPSSHGHVVHVWEAHTGKRHRRLTGHFRPITSLAYSPDGHVLASGDENGVVIIRNAHTDEQLLTIADKSARVTALTFSPDGGTLAVGHHGKVHLWATHP